MARIAVVGGTGYAGSHIVQEAASRGHQVLSLSRSLPKDRIEGVTYEQADAREVADVVRAVEGSDVVVFSMSPRGLMEGELRPAVRAIVRELPETVRVGVIGGAGGSLVAPGGPKVMDGDFPAEILPEAQEMDGVLDDLREAGGHRWFFVHPAGGFGAWAPGERTGTYRIGGDVLVVDADGKSELSGADLAVAVIDEIEKPAHEGARFTVGY